MPDTYSLTRARSSRRPLFALVALMVFAALIAVSADAAAQGKGKKGKAKGKQPAAQKCKCECDEPAAQKAIQENTHAGCQDGEDNDGDGHVDCDDQDCEIFAVCLLPAEPPVPKTPAAVEPPAPPPAPHVIYTTMRQLKQARAAGRITWEEYYLQWTNIRAWRAQELEELRAAYREGRITRRQHNHEAARVRRKYEG